MRDEPPKSRDLALRIAIAASALTAPVLLALVYFLVITPMAAVFRLIGRDALDRRIDRGAASYWKERREPPDVGRYFRTF